MIKIRNLTKKYKQFNDFKIKCSELEINKGDIVGICGPVASGKTLLSKILAGVHKKYDGQIEFGMINLGSIPKRTLSYVPSSNILYNNLTVNDHINFFASEFKINKTEINAKINWFDQFFNLSANLDKKIFSFTTGELQYIKIFLSLLYSPTILIIDELFTGLGTNDTEILKTIFEELSGREVTIIFTTSHLEYARSLTEKIKFIKDGTIGI